MAGNVSLTPDADWTIRARLQTEQWGSLQVVSGMSLEGVQADIARTLNNHVGTVTNLRVNIFRSWFASDAFDVTFTLRPKAAIQTGDVTSLSLSGPQFSPQNSVGYWVWYGANLSAANGDPINPYIEYTGGILPSNTLVVDEVKKGAQQLSTSSSTSSVGGLFRSLNTVRSTDTEQDNRLSVSVQTGEALKAASDWAVIPSWVQIILTVLPLAIVVGGTWIIGRQVYSLVKG